MQTSSLSDLKKELHSLPAEELMQLCLQLARYKKENKELLHYLLFEQRDEQAYIRAVTQTLEPEFENINIHNLYFAKKNLRRILKLLNKHIRYSGKKETEITLLLFFCQQLKATQLPLEKNKVLLNLYNRQLQKIQKSVASLHEDLQYDYQQQMEGLDIEIS